MSPVELFEDLAVPYVLVMSAVEENGNWLRRAEYPELPGCVAESPSALEAVHKLDALRIKMILDMRHRGERPPRPRPPLLSGLAILGLRDVDSLRADLLHESTQ